MRQQRVSWRSFLIIWSGQFVSLIGSGLTTFALGVWLFQRTGSVTQFALNGALGALPLIVLAPLVGAVADRYDRRWVMLFADSGSALVTLALACFLWAGQLAVGHVYLATILLTVCDCFHSPAYSATIPRLVPAHQLGRANGLISLGRSTTSIVAPAIAGVLIMTIDLRGIIVIDLATFLVAAITLATVRIPPLAVNPAGRDGRCSLWRQTWDGWAYQAARPGLLALLLFFAALNLTEGMTDILRVPLILSFATPATLGSVMALAGIGAMAGSVLMTAWGGPRRRILGVLGFVLLAGISLVAAGLRPSIALVAPAYMVRYVCGPMFSGSAQAIWQSKVAHHVQGRVAASGMMLRGIARSSAYLLAGPLADRVFEPLMAGHHPLARSLGRILGAGPGRGIGLLISVLGLMVISLSVSGYLYPRLRNIDHELPDVAMD